MDSVRSGPFGQVFRPDNFVFGEQTYLFLLVIWLSFNLLSLNIDDKAPVLPFSAKFVSFRFFIYFIPFLCERTLQWHGDEIVKVFIIAIVNLNKHNTPCPSRFIFDLTW